jgi:hypothetical protein
VPRGPRARTCSQALIAKSLRKQGGRGAFKGKGKGEVMKVEVECKDEEEGLERLKRIRPHFFICGGGPSAWCLSN